VRRMLDGRSFIEDTIEIRPLPDRPEPPRVEAVWLTKAQLLKRMKWDESALEAALGLAGPVAFPSAAKRFAPGAWGWTLTWRDTEIDAWAARVAEHVALLQRLIQK
jgi:hypothetical protein